MALMIVAAALPLNTQGEATAAVIVFYLALAVEIAGEIWSTFVESHV